MYVIEKDGVRVEGADERSAKKELRRRMEEQRKRDQEESDRRAVAKNVAMVNGYKILRLVADRRAKRQSLRSIPWRVCRVKEGGYGVVKFYDDERCQWGYRIEDNVTEGVMFPYHGNPVTHWLCDGAGWPIAIRMEGAGDCEMFAVGIHDGIVVLEDLPGVKAGDFQAELE